jgi:hypothetical protein
MAFCMKPISSEIYSHGPHPEERALARVSKDGGMQSYRLWPSFETHRCAMLLRMRLNETLY